MELMVKLSYNRGRGASLWRALLLWMGVWLAVVSCSDVEDVANAPGGVTLQLSSSDLVVKTRADEVYRTPEYYMDKVHFFFFRNDTDAEPVYRKLNVSVAEYHAKQVVMALPEAEKALLFPEGTTTCTVYAVANVALTEDWLKALPDRSIATLKNLIPVSLSGGVVASDGTTPLRTMANGDFAMDGKGTATLDKTTQTMSGSIKLERALVKLALEVSVASEVKDDNGNLYTPSTDAKGMEVILRNCASVGVLDEYARPQKADETVDRGMLNTACYCKAEEPVIFYSYPSHWTQASTFGDIQDEASFTLKIAWKRENVEASEYVPYYYQIPINADGCKLERNHYYKVKLKVGMLGMSNPDDTFTIGNVEPFISYEVLDWGEDEQSREATLQQSHYVITDDNEYTIWNLSTKEFSYNSCDKLQGVYLVSVSYESTMYTDENDNPQTAYLYKQDYDEENNTYVESSDYSDLDNTVRTTYSSVVEYLSGDLSNKLYFTGMQSNSGATGTVTFNFDVLKTAAAVYRPLTYTLALVNSKDHGQLKTYVKVVQYPARYIEYGKGGNAFVDGYYANLHPDDGYTEADLPEGAIYTHRTNGKSNQQTVSLLLDCYHSLSFVYSGYNANNGNPYYSSNSTNLCADVSINYGTSAPATTDMGGINTSYEYVRGVINNSGTLNFENTIDVYVSAFTKEDHTFTIDGKSYEYVIGDPRVEGGFIADNVHKTNGYSCSYGCTDKYLYDYLVKGVVKNSTYYRYVKSWGDDAAKIKVAGRAADYDNIIAPLYKVQSSLGAAASLTYFDVAEKRCATYQEAGYPAGRWRLPTVAEIAFLMKLQKEEVIKKMFSLNNDNGYWVSSKKAIYIENSTGNLHVRTPNRNTNQCYVRCVYDLWYWQDGDSKTHQHHPTHTYNPKPTW